MTEENKKWYVIPPYRKIETWKIYNESGEYIASFEDRENCERVVILWNYKIRENQQIKEKIDINLKKLKDL